MKKAILAIGLIVMLGSCNSNGNVETTTVDSVGTVAVDSTCCATDSTCVDSAAIVK